MAARKREVETTVWLTKRTHADDPDVLPQDWRDPDLFLDLEGAQVVSDDPAWRGHEQGTAVEPDWTLGWHIEGPGRTQPHILTGQGVPPEIFKRCLLEGRLLTGVIVARDFQRHNV